MGGLLGAVLAWAIVNGQTLGVSGGFVPVFGVSGTNAAVGVLISIGIGIVAGLIPAVMASRLKIVDALRRVA
jgi:putative ABC transport system permease protein